MAREIVWFVQGFEGQSSDLYKNPPMGLVVGFSAIHMMRLSDQNTQLAFKTVNHLRDLPMARAIIGWPIFLKPNTFHYLSDRSVI